MSTIKAVFAEEYAGARQPEGKLDLAVKLLKQADESGDDVVARYVLLSQACDLAADLADSQLINKATAALGASYRVEPLQMQVGIYQKLISKPRPAAGNSELAEALLGLVDRAIEAEQYDEAEQLAKLALTTAGKARDGQLLKQAKAKVSEAGTLKHDYAIVKDTEEKLAKSPNDGEANLGLGKYLCFVRHDWDKGLPHLAKGSDVALKALAERSIAASEQPAALAELGDRWWDAAEKAKAKEKAALRMAARHWYSLAQFAGQTGLLKTKIEKRLEDLGGPEGTPKPNAIASTASKSRAAGVVPPPAIAPFSTHEAAEHQSTWSKYLGVPVEITNSAGIKLRLVPPGEFMMGDVSAENRLPIHKVRITRPFYLGTVEVTQEQWQAVMGANPAAFANTGPNAAQVAGLDTRKFPVEMVSYQACVDFCARLSAMQLE
ncbi:MAG TPA: SUMF1/EgtB/PvdO family nonheme iron enzyme, partial [Pirellulales bacterium]